MHSFNSFFSSIRSRLLIGVDFFFPPLCIICSAPGKCLNSWLCKECEENLYKNNRKRSASSCRGCGINLEHTPCACGKKNPDSYSSIFSLFDFSADVQHLVHHVKYNGRWNLMNSVGMTFGHIIPANFLSGADAFIPVPLHFFRELSRGFNQAFFLARSLSKAVIPALPVLNHLLIRKRHTKTQTKLNKQERHHNLRNAFQIKAGAKMQIAGKCLILVDDVVTTGATVEECSIVLREAGAKELRILSLGRA